MEVSASASKKSARREEDLDFSLPSSMPPIDVERLHPIISHVIKFGVRAHRDTKMRSQLQLPAASFDNVVKERARVSLIANA